MRDTQTAEAVKITENIFRAVNIALVNELKIAYTKMGINVWDVIDAAKTKPFGFMPFYPGPGLGGHCIRSIRSISPWRAKKFNVDTHFIELAGVVNRAMPHLVVDKLSEALTAEGKNLKDAQILIMGVAYKKNVDDLRESPALEIMEIIQERGGHVSFHDPYIPEILPTREHAALQGMKSVTFDEAHVSKFDAALIATDHSNVGLRFAGVVVALIIDTPQRDEERSSRPGEDHRGVALLSSPASIARFARDAREGGPRWIDQIRSFHLGSLPPRDTGVSLGRE